MKRTLILLSIFCFLGAASPRSNWDSWAHGVSLSSASGDQQIKLYHQDDALSSISISGAPEGKPDSVAIFYEHSSRRSFIQVVDPDTGKPKYIDLVKLADSLHGDSEVLPWEQTQ